MTVDGKDIVFATYSCPDTESIKPTLNLTQAKVINASLATPFSESSSLQPDASAANCELCDVASEFAETCSCREFCL